MPPIIPLLQLSASNLTNPQDILTYLLRHFIYMPANTSDTFFDKELSLSALIAEKGAEKTIFESLVKDTLFQILINIFGSGSVLETTATMGNLDSSDKYKLSISMTIIVDGVVYSTKDSIILNKNNDNRLSLLLDGSFAYL